MIEALSILVIGVVALAILKFSDTISHRQFFYGLGGSVALAGVFMIVTSLNITALDREIWNGEVSQKRHEVQACPRGWQRYEDSFCDQYRTRQVRDGQTCTGTGKDRTCRNDYRTEYRYIYPWEGRWHIYAANIREQWEIDRVDHQGAIEPKAYTAIKVGDPAATTNIYTNWVKAAADSIFHEDGEYVEKYKGLIPEYPGEIYDVLKVRRIVSVGVPIPDIDRYNDKLAEALKTLGPQRQMNAIIVIADSTKFGPEFEYAVRRYWKGFKKNDAVTFIGVNKENIVEWASSLSWSKSSIYDVEIREKILGDRGDHPLDLDAVIDNIQTIGMQHYERRAMKEFEFLKSEVRTPMWLTIGFGFLQLVILLLTVTFPRKEKFRHVYR